MESQIGKSLNGSFRDRMNEQKILITHTDLDGVGCLTLIKKVYPNVRVIPVRNPSDLPQTIQSIMEEILVDDPMTHRDIFITDLSLAENEEASKKAVEIIEEYFKRSTRSILYVDHHKTSEWLKYKDWAIVDTQFAATKVLWKTFSEVFSLDDFADFVEMVHNYDTWNPDEKLRQLGSFWTMLISEFGVDYYIARTAMKIKGSEYHLLLPQEADLIAKLVQERNDYTDKVLGRSVYAVEQLEDGSGTEYNVLMAVASKHQSYIGNLALENIPDLEVVYLLNLESMSVSMRSRGNVDVAEIAKKHGGGGHPKAAGHPINIDIRSIINLIYYPDFKESETDADNKDTAV